MSRRQRARTRASSAAEGTSSKSNAAQVDVQLQMECEEEELSPWQEAAFAKAKKQFLEAMEKIKEARHPKPQPEVTTTPVTRQQPQRGATQVAVTPTGKQVTPRSGGPATRKRGKYCWTSL